MADYNLAMKSADLDKERKKVEEKEREIQELIQKIEVLKEIHRMKN